MKLLYLAHRIPYPPNKGDKIRSFNEVKYLGKNHQTDLICLADQPEDIRFKSNLEKYCRRVFALPFDTKSAKIKGLINLAKGGAISSGYFYHKELQQVFDAWISDTDYDAIFCFSSPMAEYIFRASDKFSKKPALIMDFCDVDSDKWRQYSQQSAFPMNLVYRMEYKRLLAYEKQINACFDHSVFVSQKEAELFYDLYPKARNVKIIPNGVDYEYFSPKADTEKNHRLMFAGAMDYHANIDGVEWFCRDILPNIQQIHPDIEFYIVGSKPAAKVLELSKQKGVFVTGFVEDIREYYDSAQICTIPLRLARGVQNKVLEAMAMGKAVVATSAAIRGIMPVAEDCLLIADTEKAFAEKVLLLLEDVTLRKTLGNNAREFVMQRYCWENNMRKAEEILSL